jgi:uncharacterized membrane protein YeaQ/YmgE (transglycosylase-associated protein family)
MDMNIVGWIVVGLIAGSISGWFVRGDRGGCLVTIVIGVVGGLIGGWISRLLGMGNVEGFFSAIFAATLGAILVRLVLNMIAGRERR